MGHRVHLLAPQRFVLQQGLLVTLILRRMALSSEKVFMTPKPEWLVAVLDTAQIVSAIFTAGAVIVAIWLARRSESQRLRFAIGLTQMWRPRGVAREGVDIYPAVLLTIVNAGILPATVATVSYRVVVKNGGTLPGPVWRADQKLEWPLVLQHGESIGCEFPVRRGVEPWRDLHMSWWYWRRPSFYIETSLGKTHHVKISRTILRQIKSQWHAEDQQG